MVGLLVCRSTEYRPVAPPNVAIVRSLATAVVQAQWMEVGQPVRLGSTAMWEMTSRLPLSSFPA